jgi:hypothetical protein
MALRYPLEGDIPFLVKEFPLIGVGLEEFIQKYAVAFLSGAFPEWRSYQISIVQVDTTKSETNNMIDHVILTVSDFKGSVAFYTKALKPLGITNFIDYEGKDGHPDLKGFGDGKRG